MLILFDAVILRAATEYGLYHEVASLDTSQLEGFGPGIESKVLQIGCDFKQIIYSRHTKKKN